MNPIVEELLRQVDLMRPDRFVPGKNVGARVLPSERGVQMVFASETGGFRQPERIVEILYDEGRDAYDVSVSSVESRWVATSFEGLYVDQVGGVLWGEDPKDYPEPLVEVLEWKEDETMDEALARHKVL